MGQIPMKQKRVTFILEHAMHAIWRVFDGYYKNCTEHTILMAISECQ